MISRIKGVVLETRLTSLVVDVSGLGYEVTVAPEISSSISSGREIELYTSQVIRKESKNLLG